MTKIKLNIQEIIFYIMQCLVVDCLTAGKGRRRFTRDFIGSGPRYIGGFIEQITKGAIKTELYRVEDIIQKEPRFFKKYQIVCFSAMTMDESSVARAFNLWKAEKQHKNVLSLMGGPITQDHSIIKRIPVDFAILGEGEPSIIALFQDYLTNITDFLKQPYSKDSQKSISQILPRIPNILYRRQGKIKRSINQELDDVTIFTESSGYPEKILNYSNFENSRIYVEILRGCSNYRRTALKLSQKLSCSDNSCQICRNEPFSVKSSCPVNIPPGCGFCSTINEFGSPKSRSCIKILEEIKFLISHGAKRIVLGGPDFLDYKREELVKGPLINPKFPEPNYSALETLVDHLVNIPEVKLQQVQLFIENIKASLCTNRSLDILSKIPNAIFSIGCETGSAAFANILGRPSLPEDTYQAIKLAKNKGIRIHVYFIHSLPGDTFNYATETLNFMKSIAALEIEKITLYKYRELPGSPFHQSPRQLQQFDKKTLKLFDKIKKFSIKYNEKQKQKLLGKKVRVFLSEKNIHYPTDAIGWILEGGPKVSVKNGIKFLNEIKTVQIKQILSDKLVLGEIV